MLIWLVDFLTPAPTPSPLHHPKHFQTNFLDIFKETQHILPLDSLIAINVPSL
jgi:hypothetical protein